ncbi:MAJOR FACILITATOR SUPERFAMILY PROTEIN [Salix koriyanagi]|uniref:MAJOR FACILITATOR SUPERFAMILY PROTEIN n=1 Tax=Salix koriyanagi TaxID=2511006 RepID=A0A9Q0V018_9ROSI|nr:MAJOR FACILITATOR SUPERFAMILY PROTEIN [Salix koriyanagi]
MGFHQTSSISFSATKWLGFVTAVWVQAISGNNYTFSNYSDALKSLMNLTQLELNNLSVAKDVGKAFGLLAGLASDRLPTPVILLIGSIEGLIGYGTQWLVVSREDSASTLLAGGNSTTWMNTAVLVTCIRNFRRNRGPVSGILKGYVGLSTAIFTDLCSALFADEPAKFLIMLAVIPFAVCLAAIVFLRETRTFRHSSPLAVPVHAFIKSWTLNRFKNQADVERQIQEPLLREERAQEEIQEKPAEESASAVVEQPQAAEEKAAVEVKEEACDRRGSYNFRSNVYLRFLDSLCVFPLWGRHRFGCDEQHGTDWLGSWIC